MTAAAGEKKISDTLRQGSNAQEFNDKLDEKV